jgi:hypothetical protein
VGAFGPAAQRLSSTRRCTQQLLRRTVDRFVRHEHHHCSRRVASAAVRGRSLKRIVGAASFA